MIPWGAAVPIFLGTLPLLFVMAWNIVEIKSFRGEARAEFARIGTELTLTAIHTEIANIRERLATRFFLCLGWCLMSFFVAFATIMFSVVFWGALIGHFLQNLPK